MSRLRKFSPRDKSESTTMRHLYIMALYSDRGEIFIKLGIAHNVLKRYKEIQRARPPFFGGHLWVVCSWMGFAREEKKLHKRFSAERIEGTEWFRPSPALAQFVMFKKDDPASELYKVTGWDTVLLDFERTWGRFLT